MVAVLVRIGAIPKREKQTSITQLHPPRVGAQQQHKNRSVGAIFICTQISLIKKHCCFFKAQGVS
jgi:hypothetical protein